MRERPECALTQKDEEEKISLATFVDIIFFMGIPSDS
jgi:hypothetical protein